MHYRNYLAVLVYFYKAVLESGDDAALLASLKCGDFLFSLSCVQKIVPKPFGAYGGACGFTPLRGTQICLGEANTAICPCCE